MKYIIALALLVALILLYRKWIRASRQRFLDQFEMPAAVVERAFAKHPELTPEQIRLVRQGLQQYFRICVAAGGRFVSMPSQVVDDLWHAFILFTRQYEQFCRRAFGSYLHHTPVEAMPARDTATEGIRRTWRLACQMEGIDPKHPQRLPLLFALDAQLGIAGGFIYTLNCKDAATSSSGTFCASDIGSCGGDSGGGDSGGSDGGSSCGSGCGGGGD
jgi:hypothetical protein